MDIMATELNTAELSIDEEIDQIANEIANELAEDSNESPDKPGAGGTGSAPESGKVTKAATPKGKKLTKKKVSAGAETKGEGDDPAEIEVYEAADEDDDEEENGEKKKNPFAKNGKKNGKKKGKNPFAKNDDDDDDDVAEETFVPETKQEIIRAVFETMKDVDADQLAGAYSKLMSNLLDESVPDDEDAMADTDSGSIERKVYTSEDFDISEDLVAIFGEQSDSLSEEFKTQVQTVFEAALVAKTNSELDNIEKAFASKLTESKDEILSTITDKVDNYLSYVVEEWVKENELAIDRGVKAEITEDFIGGLKQLFEDHYIDIPEEKVDVVDSLADRVDQLERELNETLETNIGMASQIKSFQKDEILGDLSDDLTDVEIEKLKGLSEGVGFENGDQYKTSLETIKENYFPRTSTSSPSIIDEELEMLDNDDDDNVSQPKTVQMAAYVSAIGSAVENR
jgi:hypothetical protein